MKWMTDSGGWSYHRFIERGGLPTNKAKCGYEAVCRITETPHGTGKRCAACQAKKSTLIGGNPEGLSADQLFERGQKIVKGKP